MLIRRALKHRVQLRADPGSRAGSRSFGWDRVRTDSQHDNRDAPLASTCGRGQVRLSFSSAAQARSAQAIEAVCRPVLTWSETFLQTSTVSSRGAPGNEGSGSVTPDQRIRTDSQWPSSESKQVERITVAWGEMVLLQRPE